MKKKERREVKELINLLVKCDKTLSFFVEKKIINPDNELFVELEKFGITDLWYGPKHNFKKSEEKNNGQ